MIFSWGEFAANAPTLSAPGEPQDLPQGFQGGDGQIASGPAYAYFQTSFGLTGDRNALARPLRSTPATEHRRRYGET
jgi:hypothetical protein